MPRDLIPSPAAASVPARLFTPTPKVTKRVFEFFTTQISNQHTRKAYLNATRRFAQWCETRGIRELAAVEPYHIAAFIKGFAGQGPSGKTSVGANRQATPGRAADVVRLAGDRSGH